MKVFQSVLVLYNITNFIIIINVFGFELPKSCKKDEYYEPSSLACFPCSVNASMITASDGFGCICNDHSISVGPSKCKQCGPTEVVSMDGSACVPRRCQNTTKGVVCRKCPSDYISVTQNIDGSPTKEVLCVKCSRGYKAQNNRCVRCESCICSRSEVVVRGKCIPKRYVTERPKYEDTQLHPNTLLDIVKHEYLCVQRDIRACRILADECARSSYPTDLAGPCRLWIQNTSIHFNKDIPQLSFASNSNDKQQCQVELKHSQKTMLVALAAYTTDGGIEFLQDPDKTSCLPPLTVNIGNDYSCDYHMNVTKLLPYTTLSPYIQMNEDWLPIPVSIRKSNGYYLQKGVWPTDRFKRYFLLHNFQSTTVNITSTVYLKTLIIRVSIQRDTSKRESITATVSMEAHYADKSLLSSSVTTSIRVEHELPRAGISKGLEVWGGVLGVISVLYGAVQWRGALRRGSLHYSIVPILAGCVADALYFAALFSTLNSIAVEVSTSGLILAPSYSEEHLIGTFLLSAAFLKVLKVAFLNWNQCRCDIFFLDWTKYNSSLKEKSLCDNGDNWKTATVAREWSSMQAKRRASPSYTVLLTLALIKVTINHWDSNLPNSSSYYWTVTTLGWWISYSIVLLSRWTIDRISGKSSEKLSKVCSGVGVSLLVFEEELYAHYVHGRYDESSDARFMSGPLATCRIACAPQLRTIYNQLTKFGPDNVGLGDSDAKQALLSRFLAAFFERALDGVSWVASERTVLERLMNVELIVRESGNTSTLLYDSNDSTPSCLTLTWWGEEWALATFDAIIFGCFVITTGDYLTAALAIIFVWQLHAFKYSEDLIRLVRMLRSKLNIPRANENDIDISAISLWGEGDTRPKNALRSDGIFEEFLSNLLELLTSSKFPDRRVKSYCTLINRLLRKMTYRYAVRLGKHLKKMCNSEDGWGIKSELLVYQQDLNRKTEYKTDFLDAMNSAFTIRERMLFYEYLQELSHYAVNERPPLEDETVKLLRDVIAGSIHYRLSYREQKALGKKLRQAIREYRGVTWSSDDTSTSSDDTSTSSDDTGF